MLRCPFNNFSKCDGSCPFSMPDFSGCRLATSMTAIEGIVRGISERTQKMHVEQVNTNAHLAEVNRLLDDGVLVGGVRDESDGQSKKPARIRDPRTYIRKESTQRFCLYLSVEDTEDVAGMFGASATAVIIPKPNPRIMIVPGNANAILMKKRSNRGTINFKSACTSDVESAFGEHRYIFLRSIVDDGIMTLTLDEESPYADE